MSLPKLTPGQRFNQTLPPETADALLLAQFAQREKGAGRLAAVVCADASHARRLLQELPFFLPGLRCALFPDWETLPYDQFSPHQDLISERLATLWAIRQGELDVVLIPASTALYRLAPPAFLAAYTFSFAKGQQLDEAKLKEQLTLAGYQHVSQVVGHGEYAVRGGLIDLFPMGAEQPYRVDLFDDEIDSIRIFDPDTQRSQHEVKTVRLPPGREFPMDEAARSQFRNRWRELMEGDPTKSRIYKDMGAGMATAGIEYYLPLFFDSTATVFDYLGDSASLVLHGDIAQPLESFWQDTRERWRMVQGDPEHPALPPESLFLSVEQFYALAKPYGQWALRPAAGKDAQKDAESLPAWLDGTAALPPLTAERGADEPLQRLKNHLASLAAAPEMPQRCLILAESLGRRESLLDFLRASDLYPQTVDSLQAFQQGQAPLGITVAPLSRGFRWQQAGIDLITETELFASAGATRRRHKKQEQVSDVDMLIRDLAELKVGDPVVHSQHGIGRYQGLLHMDMGQTNTDGSPALQEFLHLEYADKAALYVPVSQLQQISRYTGVNPESAPLHKLGGTQWEKAKRKAAEQVRDAAAELLNIYARRAARQGHAFRLNAQDYAQFAEDFGFEETADQQAAIAAVVGDLISPQPMDRLVCGDVGFGKTEVALRAAFVAAMAGKQVAFLAPTTLLAEQHYQTLTDRFAKWPVRIAEMSRFRTTKEINAALKGLAEGSIDIVVGTHKLLSANTKFKDLGLLIVDEEHRFGVRHKEAMKQLRAEVDVLTLTATPIPRTMGMALEGLRDLSVIATAPERRLAIKTFVRSESQGVIREAVLREFKRGGQVYFLHNEVDTIENRRQQLEAFLPEARIAIAHGQMPERELERVMRDFVAQRFNLLLCSTIIETGIDVPTANTIIMARADKFGLAQLHQLRGRVGRSHHQAYAYLMVPDVQSLAKPAQQRLEAIQEMEELGSGFYLAMHDLEIRGAGEVLGEHQSGNMTEIGFQLYYVMLSVAVRSLKAGKEPDLVSPLQAATDINLHAPALLTNEYCGDVQLRLSLYKKLASAKTSGQIDA
ncbi:MAG: transcription-repair coupling factor, partial [Comamonas sp.]|nr:transcription-repair coupling factor [Comamonas sp.]